LTASSTNASVHSGSTRLSTRESRARERLRAGEVCLQQQAEAIRLLKATNRRQAEELRTLQAQSKAITRHAEELRTL